MIFDSNAVTASCAHGKLRAWSPNHFPMDHKGGPPGKWPQEPRRVLKTWFIWKSWTQLCSKDCSKTAFKYRYIKIININIKKCCPLKKMFSRPIGRTYFIPKYTQVREQQKFLQLRRHWNSFCFWGCRISDERSTTIAETPKLSRRKAGAWKSTLHEFSQKIRGFWKQSTTRIA